MSGSNITVRGSFEVPSAAGSLESAVVYSLPIEPDTHIDMLQSGAVPMHRIANRITGYMQTTAGIVGRVNSMDVAAHVASEDGYRFAATEANPMEPLAFAFVRELPPRESLVHRVGSTATDFVLEQFGVTWAPQRQEVTLPPRYRSAANGLLRVITDGMRQGDNIYVTGYPYDTRDPNYFTQYGFQQVSEGVHRVWERSGWGGEQEVLYGARVGFVQQAIRGEIPIQQVAEKRSARRNVANVVRPAVSA